MVKFNVLVGAIHVVIRCSKVFAILELLASALVQYLLTVPLNFSLSSVIQARSK